MRDLYCPKFGQIFELKESGEYSLGTGAQPAGPALVREKQRLHRLRASRATPHLQNRGHQTLGRPRKTPRLTPSSEEPHDADDHHAPAQPLYDGPTGDPGVVLVFEKLLDGIRLAVLVVALHTLTGDEQDEADHQNDEQDLHAAGSMLAGRPPSKSDVARASAYRSGCRGLGRKAQPR